jgi:hypothetical protein
MGSTLSTPDPGLHIERLSRTAVSPSHNRIHANFRMHAAKPDNLAESTVNYFDMR